MRAASIEPILPANLAWISRMKITQPDNGIAMQTTGAEIRVGSLHQLIPLSKEMVQLGADPAQQKRLVGTGQMRKKQRGSQLKGGTAYLWQVN
jgi:hypothetical protein